ncbi:MAG: RecQ family ATP-dependent DNA helicase [Bacteroidaceae bacterium]|nr:RecQ family ATP-dependent DNA helicase [Bacteroidaceae bacterium]
MQQFKDILQQYWGYPDFRGIQTDIIRSIANQRDTLGLMPTGGGKSITFQVPALAMDGVCLVITPLIALMKDQIFHLKQRGISSEAIYTGVASRDIDRILDNAIFGAVKFLYVSPERLSSELFVQKLRRMQLCFITIDEAHCISQWGYDFRPAYLRIADIRKIHPSVPVLALTATATPQVVDDIQEKLCFAEKNVFKMSFERKNLNYVVRHTANKENEMLHILRSVPGPAIVYTRSRQGTKDVAALLKAEGMGALYYHAGLSTLDKEVRQEMWQEGVTRIMVATNAFGMGIDKPDVRLVIHLDFPDSVEAYFQEAGRAGRDGQTSYAVLLVDKGDGTKMIRRVPETYPPLDFVKTIYDDLGSYFQMAVGDGENVTREFNLDRFCVNFRHFPVQTESALNILSRAGYIDYREPEEGVSRLMFISSRDDLYRFHGMQINMERVLMSVLRLYCGFFSDYINIEEDRIAKESGLTEREVYEALKGLTYQRILNYIPKKNTAYITYLQRRVEGKHLYFSPAVYKERKENYEARIQAMVNYAESDDQCRSTLLLRYFGEENGEDCGCCDVCLARRRKPIDAEAVKKEILKILADGLPHPVKDFAQLSAQFTKAMKRTAWEQLVADGVIGVKDGEVVLIKE